MIRSTSILLAGSIALAGFFNVGGCIISDDVDDFPFMLPPKTFRLDTSEFQLDAGTTIECGTTVGICSSISSDLQCGMNNRCELKDPTLFPVVPCDAVDSPCSRIHPEMYCDLTVNACAATVSFELVTLTRLADEVPELQTVGQSSFTTVSFDYIRMIVEENTFSVQTPPVDFYVGPDTVASLWILGSDPSMLDPEVAQVGTIPPIPVGSVGQTLDVDLRPAGEAELTEYCRTPENPFNLFVYGEYVLQGGDPIPQGALTLTVDAQAVVGLN